MSAVDESRPVRHDQALTAAGIVLAMVLMGGFESQTHVSVFHAALLAAGAMGVTGCISAGQARRSLDLPVLVAIAAALVIGQAIATSGLASATAEQIIRISSGYAETMMKSPSASRKPRLDRRAVALLGSCTSRAPRVRDFLAGARRGVVVDDDDLVDDARASNSWMQRRIESFSL